jgi:hypothetical protein
VALVARECTQLTDLRVAAWPTADTDPRTGRGPARSVPPTAEWGLHDASLRCIASGPVGMALARLDMAGHMGVTDAGVCQLRKLPAIASVSQRHLFPYCGYQSFQFLKV